MPRQQERENYKKKNPGLAKSYSTVVPGKSEFWRIINLFRPNTWKKTTDQDAYDAMKIDSNKTFWDVAMKDMWAYPNAVAWATSFFPKAGTLIASTVKGKERRNATNKNIDKSYENIWFRQWKSNKIAYDLWQEAAELWASLWTALPIASKLFQWGKAIWMFKKTTKIPKWLWITSFGAELAIPSTASANAFEYEDTNKFIGKQNNSQSTIPKNTQQWSIPVYYNSKWQAMIIWPQWNFIPYK